ncbi:hypothetical protein OCU04_012026 [Sclerotinia nivalis]|uniref:Uncharacterized protein n=1 Tax=Sclerotinia nivalis TaxID=352851 RepID=A0A9X0AA73_9HELO|nr:hypothetical protein OCU04_012026 [Sclerotinia nivalis]
MKNFFTTICSLASIAVVAVEMPPGSPTKPNPFDIDYNNFWDPTHWELDLNCAFDHINDNFHCHVLDWASKDPIPTQPVREDFSLEPSSQMKQREAQSWEDYFPNKNDFTLIKVDRMTIWVDFDRKLRELGTTNVISMKASCVKDNGYSSYLWCEHDSKTRTHKLSELKEL